MHNFFKYLPLLAALLLLSGCRASRNVESSATTTTETQGNLRSSALLATEYVKKVTANAQTAQTLTARIKMNINADGKNVSVSGQLRMKRDDVVQLSLTMLGFEVGRMEFSPADVLIIDRYNRQYVRATYSDVSFLRAAGLDFKALQALFWGELFVPGEKSVGTGDRFSLSSAGSHTLLSLKDAPKLNYDFLTQTATASIDRVTVESKNAAQAGKFEWRYADFTTVDGKPFPGQMTCAVTGVGKDAGFTLNLSRIGHDTDWTAHTEVSSKYTRRSADEILGKLIGM
ncbi:MAG: DUF4292 domain-containing protein [Bacteroidales bacterium]|nr:DUF4292 domain-containing protein [Bacteroidales bacterium]